MKNAWSKWKIIAGKVGNIQADIFLTVIYFLIILPISLIRKLSGNGKDIERASYWIIRPKFKQDMNWAKKQ